MKGELLGYIGAEVYTGYWWLLVVQAPPLRTENKNKNYKCKSTVRCKVKGCNGKTFIKCTTCKVHLCFTGYRNCFADFHKFDC